ncbi:myb/sant-like dna-binding domain [Holotrichia oblita]|uniref:Myb/sant-like dna-binding domain n=1 Tax=Holotrichia oblita TaxID=644536 RepID=A0ACB9THG9_HOLOL|nr:myb/sant-like dna-binding domain [Holotrichia oblita]
MDDIYEQLTDEDFVELIRIVENRRAPKRYMHRRDHFNTWTEQEFRQRYRLSKDTVRFVIHEISDENANNTAVSECCLNNIYLQCCEHLLFLRNHSVSAEDMVLLTLRFLATGSFLRVASDIHGIHESTASRIVTKVLYASSKA